MVQRSQDEASRNEDSHWRGSGLCSWCVEPYVPKESWFICITDRFDGNTDTFVELKTSLTIRDPRDEARFEKFVCRLSVFSTFYSHPLFQETVEVLFPVVLTRRTCKIPPFLLGVRCLIDVSDGSQEIRVGFRTPSGQLSTLQSFNTLQIPRMVRDKPGSWDPQLCLDWGKRFIALLKTNISASTANTSPQVWRAKFVPRSGVTLALLDPPDVENVVNGEERFGFLPSWYLDELKGSPEIKQSSSSETSHSVPVPEPQSSTQSIPPRWQL